MTDEQDNAVTIAAFQALGLGADLPVVHPERPLDDKILRTIQQRAQTKGPVFIALPMSIVQALVAEILRSRTGHA